MKKGETLRWVLDVVTVGRERCFDRASIIDRLGAWTWKETYRYIYSIWTALVFVRPITEEFLSWVFSLTTLFCFSRYFSFFLVEKWQKRKTTKGRMPGMVGGTSGESLHGCLLPLVVNPRWSCCRKLGDCFRALRLGVRRISLCSRPETASLELWSYIHSLDYLPSYCSISDHFFFLVRKRFAESGKGQINSKVEANTRNSSRLHIVLDARQHCNAITKVRG